MTETVIHDVHKPSSSARLIAAWRWLVPSRYARKTDQIAASVARSEVSPTS